jgi:hypothetical protein
MKRVGIYLVPSMKEQSFLQYVWPENSEEIMRKYVSGLLILALLSGCASATPKMSNNNDNDFRQRKAAEEAEWARLAKLSSNQCGASVLPPERGKATELSNCVTELVKVYVLPKATYPDLLLSSREQALHIAREYDEGRISAKEYKARSEARLKKYSSSVAYFGSQEAPPSQG